jgi:hypothetical protein
MQENILDDEQGLGEQGCSLAKAIDSARWFRKPGSESKVWVWVKGFFGCPGAMPADPLRQTKDDDPQASVSEMLRMFPFFLEEFLAHLHCLFFEPNVSVLG